MDVLNPFVWNLAEGVLDLEQLQFVSTDIIFDRNAFNADEFDLFSKFLRTRMSDFKSELGFYGMKNSVNQIPEYGFKFSNENIFPHTLNTSVCLSKGNSSVTPGFERQ